MASTLRFDNWENSNGDLIGTAADGYLGVPGTVLQVVSDADGTTITTSSTSPIAHSNLSVSITPKSVSSKILVRVIISRADNTSAQASGVYIYRDGAQIGGGLISSNYINSTGNQGGPICLEFLDSPATISAVTYAPYIYVSGGTGSFRTGTITAMEIAG